MCLDAKMVSLEEVHRHRSDPPERSSHLKQMQISAETESKINCIDNSGEVWDKRPVIQLTNKASTVVMSTNWKVFKIKNRSLETE